MPSNRASFSLNGTTGEITSYYASWNTNLDFPSPENKIPLEEAQKIFKENMPLDLEYNIDKDGRVYLQYTRSREKGSMYINAITGEVEKPEYYYGIYQNGIRYAEDEAMKSAMGAALRPEEQKQVDNIAGLITAQEAEKKLRLVKELDFDEKYKLTSSNLYQSTDLRSNETKYYINLYFTHMDNTEDLSEEKINLKIAAGEGDGYASATLNAKTGELISFSSNIWGIPRPMSKAEDTADEKQTKAKREQAKKTADAFVSKMQPEKVNKVKFMDDGSSDNFTFNYARMENGAYFIYDSINVSVNKENMKISQYNCNWTDVNEIPPTDGAIGLDKAHEILFGSEALALEYIINEKDKKAVLAYRLSDDNPWLIDAKTGMLLDWSGKQYVKEKAPEYSDIAGHFCEEAVKQLAIVGVFLKGDRFEPDIEILQKDYVILLSKLGRYYYYESDNIDDIYSRFIKEGIMDKAEKNPDGTVSREDAVKYLLRYLGFKKFAEIPGIFNCDFSDADEIAPELAGYAAIAKGLGIVKGSDGKFMPKEALTKAEAAVLIYNCLKADF